MRSGCYHGELEREDKHFEIPAGNARNCARMRDKSAAMSHTREKENAAAKREGNDAR